MKHSLILLSFVSLLLIACFNTRPTYEAYVPQASTASLNSISHQYTNSPISSIQVGIPTDWSVASSTQTGPAYIRMGKIAVTTEVSYIYSGITIDVFDASLYTPPHSYFPNVALTNEASPVTAVTLTGTETITGPQGSTTVHTYSALYNNNLIYFYDALTPIGNSFILIRFVAGEKNIIEISSLYSSIIQSISWSLSSIMLQVRGDSLLNLNRNINSESITTQATINDSVLIKAYLSEYPYNESVNITWSHNNQPHLPVTDSNFIFVTPNSPSEDTITIIAQTSIGQIDTALHYVSTDFYPSTIKIHSTDEGFYRDTTRISYTVSMSYDSTVSFTYDYGLTGNPISIPTRDTLLIPLDSLYSPQLVAFTAVDEDGNVSTDTVSFNVSLKPIDSDYTPTLITPNDNGYTIIGYGSGNSRALYIDSNGTPLDSLHLLKTLGSTYAKNNNDSTALYLNPTWTGSTPAEMKLTVLNHKNELSLQTLTVGSSDNISNSNTNIFSFGTTAYSVFTSRAQGDSTSRPASLRIVNTAGTMLFDSTLITSGYDVIYESHKINDTLGIIITGLKADSIVSIKGYNTTGFLWETEVTQYDHDYFKFSHSSNDSLYLFYSNQEYSSIILSTDGTVLQEQTQLNLSGGFCTIFTRYTPKLVCRSTDTASEPSTTLLYHTDFSGTPISTDTIQNGYIYSVQSIFEGKEGTAIIYGDLYTQNNSQKEKFIYDIRKKQFLTYF